MDTGSTKYAELFYSAVDNDIDTLEKNVKDYPASSIARFLLLYHYKKTGHPKFDELAQQTGVYINNPYWIQYQLAQAAPLNEKEISKEEEKEIPIVTDSLANEKSYATKATEEETTSTVTNQPISSDTVENDEVDTKENDDEILTETKEEETAYIVNNQPITTDTVENDDVDTKENDDEILTEVKEEEEATSTVTNQPITSDTLENDDADTVENEDVDEELIAFEPLHTVDYFASQGIKITREELENDHFGKQVKSFTAWLKSMKKLHPAQVPEQNEVIEKIIQTSSEVSNQDANVLTEAMAEVLVKQDKKAKAIEMYQKLSLINPSKSAYFAAKIESLNH